MENPLADILEKQTSTFHRRLPFEEQCAWHIALKLGVNPRAVALAAQIALPTVSYLREAGSFRSGQLRYPKVAREYQALGHEAFVHKYLTAPIREQIAAAVHTVERNRRNPDMLPSGYNPRATGMLGRVEWTEAQSSTGRHTVFRIELHPNLGGYFWRDLKPFYEKPEIPYDRVPYEPACHLVGDPSRGPERGPNAKGFPTSKACFKHVKGQFNPKVEAGA